MEQTSKNKSTKQECGFNTQMDITTAFYSIFFALGAIYRELTGKTIKLPFQIQGKNQIELMQFGKEGEITEFFLDTNKYYEDRKQSFCSDESEA